MTDAGSRRAGRSISPAILAGCAVLFGCAPVCAQMPPMGDFSGYERIDRTQVLARLTGARFIGDLRQADLRGAHLARLDGAADMKNQSMGLMHAVISSADLSWADLREADLSRADFSFSTLAGADLRGVRIFGGDFSGTSLARANLSGADLRESKFIDTDFSGA